MRFLVLVLFLGGCSALTSVATGLLGGGLNANVNAGQEVTQGARVDVGDSQSIVRPRARDIRQESNQTRADTIQTFNAGIPPIYWIAWAFSLFIALWLDSPKRWPGQIVRAFRRK